ncbi:MAG: Rieske (2Fe-2S) protein [bacterium]|nr:Rieske (2Fe-2S) protein [bacterium]
MSDDTSRRDFMRTSLTTAAVAGGAGACMCGLSGCAGNTPKVDDANVKQGDGILTLEVAKIPGLAKVGGSVQMAVGDDSLIIVRTEEDAYVALSNACTHFGRSVDYNAASGKLVCCSFGHSEFGLDGKVLKGPAKTALKCYETTVKDGKLTIAV